MNRKEAEKLIGTHVSAWTAANGCYVGTLIEVTNNKPWRGKVKITGVTQIATPYEVGRRFQRKGFRPGDVIEVGGMNIKPTTVTGISYLDGLRSELSRYEDYKKRFSTGEIAEKDKWWIEKGYEEILNRIREEEAVLQSGPKVGSISLSPRSDLNMPFDLQSGCSNV